MHKLVKASIGLLFVCGLFGGMGLGALVSDTSHADAATCSGTAPKQYAGLRSTTEAYGLDGYLHYGSGSLAYPDCSFLAHFIAVLEPFDGAWVQVGVTIGALPTPPGGVPTTFKLYSDGQNNCGSYSLTNHGNPTSNNQAYYINYTGSSGTSCGTTFYQYAVRKDDWYNAPIWYRNTSSADGRLYAQYEAMKYASVASWPDTGDAWWGHQSAGSWPPSHGLAWYWYVYNDWYEWTAPDGGVSTPLGSTYKWCVDSVYRAHHAKKGSTC